MRMSQVLREMIVSFELFAAHFAFKPWQLSTFVLYVPHDGVLVFVNVETVVTDELAVAL